MAYGCSCYMCRYCGGCEYANKYKVSNGTSSQLNRSYDNTLLSAYLNPTLRSKEDQPEPKSMSRLSNLAKKIVDADIAILVKAGWLNGSLEITSEGRDAALTHYMLANKKTLALEAKKLIDERKEEEDEDC